MAKYDLVLGSLAPIRINKGDKAQLCIHKITPPSGPATTPDPLENFLTVDEAKALIDAGYTLEACFERIFFNMTVKHGAGLAVTSLVEVV